MLGGLVHKNHCPIEVGLADSCFSWKMPQTRAFGHCVFGRCENAVERLQNSDFPAVERFPNQVTLRITREIVRKTNPRLNPGLLNQNAKSIG